MWAKKPHPKYTMSFSKLTLVARFDELVRNTAVLTEGNESGIRRPVKLLFYTSTVKFRKFILVYLIIH